MVRRRAEWWVSRPMGRVSLGAWDCHFGARGSSVLMLWPFFASVKWKWGEIWVSLRQLCTSKLVACSAAALEPPSCAQRLYSAILQ